MHAEDLVPAAVHVLQKVIAEVDLGCPRGHCR